MKRNLALGIVVLVFAVVLAIGQYYFMPQSFRESGVKAFGWLIMLLVGLGIVLSVMALNYVINKLLSGKPNLFGLSSIAPTGSKIGSYAAGLLSYPFALFLGFIVGGSLGGGVGEMITHPLGLGDSGVVVGIGLGVFVVTTLISVVAVLVGFVLGGLTEKVVKELRT